MSTPENNAGEGLHETNLEEGAQIGETAAEPGSAPARGRIDPATKRVVTWVGIAFAVAIVVTVGLFFLSSGKKTVQPTVTLPQGNTAKERDVKLTPYEQGVLAEKQRLDAENNKLAGGVYVPPPSGAPDQRPGGPQQAGAPVTTNQVAQPTPQRQGQPDDQTRQQYIVEGLGRQLQALLKDEDTVIPPAITRVAEYQPPKRATTSGAAGTGSASTGASVSSGFAATDDPDLPGVLTIHIGHLTAPIDTAQSSFVTAKIDAGKFAGAFLRGTAVLNKGEGLQVTFDTMRFNNKVVKINAVALDEQTSTDALAGNVDRHVLTKYVLPVAFATLAGGMNAIAQRSSEIVNTGLNSSVVVPEATSRQAGAAGLAAAGQVGQQIVSSMANQPNTATLPANTSIGIMFMSVQAPAANSSGTAPASQNQTQVHQMTAEEIAAAGNARANQVGAAVTNAAMQGQQQGAYNAVGNVYMPNYGSFALPPSALTYNSDTSAGRN